MQRGKILSRFTATLDSMAHWSVSDLSRPVAENEDSAQIFPHFRHLCSHKLLKLMKVLKVLTRTALPSLVGAAAATHFCCLASGTGFGFPGTGIIRCGTLCSFLGRTAFRTSG